MNPGLERYRRVFRWHFFAGLFCLPFMMWLALTGAVYLFKPQIEAVLDRPFGAVTRAGVARAPDAALIQAALAANPGSTFRSYLVPSSATAAVQILTARDGQLNRVYVHPQTTAILQNVAEEARPMRRLFHLHGELLLGDRGSNLIELAASWGIVLLISGLYLHWPRDAQFPAGILYPRMVRGRGAWREWHAVIGMYISLFTLFFLISGLPWAAGWGGVLKSVRALGAAPAMSDPMHAGHMAEKSGQQSMPATWTTGASDEQRTIAAAAARPTSFGPVPQLLALAARLDLPAPVYLDAPNRQTQADVWTIRSDTQNRPARSSVSVRSDLTITARRDFAQLDPVDRVVAVGVAAHEGQLFGIFNQLLGLATALGLVAVSMGGARMWWMRRAAARATPAVAAGSARPYGFYAIIAVMALALPFMGVSLVFVLLIELLLTLQRQAFARMR